MFVFVSPCVKYNLFACVEVGGELVQRFGIHFDGLLGQEILNQFRSIRIVCKTHTIEVER